MRSNFRLILHIIGLLMIINALAMALCMPWSIYYNDGALGAIGFAASIVAILGLLLWFGTRKHQKNLSKRDGFLVVTMGWAMLSLSGSLPYLTSGAIPQLAAALFETVSGYTTTGASVLTDIEIVPKSILFWRSFTQWIGGMGIIVLAIAILPLLGIGGMELFMAESPGPTADKLHPRIKETARRLWYVYLSLTALEVIMLMMADMDLFESICHSMTTLSTGGFSTRNASLAAYDATIQYIVIAFMFISGVNFALNYFLIVGKFSKVWANEEFRTYCAGVLSFTALVAIGLMVMRDGAFESSIRDSLFQVVSVITTTGFVTADYTAWTPFLTVIFLMLLFVGGSAGSTSGAVKMIRFNIIIKNGLLELKRILHPNAIIPVRFSGRAMNEQVVYNIMAFFLLYVTIFVVGAMVLAGLGLDLESAIGASATCLGNVGPGIGKVGPVNNFSWVPPSAQVVLSVLMIIGRLELFTVLVLFTPAFWRSN